jgi:enediyne biosynthesis protein E4
MIGRRRVFWIGLGVVAAVALSVAVASRSRRPVTQKMSRDEAVRRAQTALLDGRLSEVESLLLPFVREHSPKESLARALFERVLELEGRRTEFRAMLAEDAQSWDDPTRILQELWRNDTAPYPAQAVREQLEAMARRSPKDERVWLALGNLATRTGSFGDAARWLSRLDPASDDPAVVRARLDLAIARSDPAGARSVLIKISENFLSPAEILALRAWFAARRSDATAERLALESLIPLDPSRGAAVERLAELSALAGSAEVAIHWRARKARLDRAHDPYRRLIVSTDVANHASELARLAEELGRFVEARGWWRLAMSRDPSDAEAKTALPRLAGTVASKPLPSSTLSALLAETVPLDRGNRSSEIDPTRIIGPPPKFIDDADRAGLRFVYRSGQSVVHQLPETMGSGVGLIDYDGDGFLDVYVVQGGRFPPNPTASSENGDRLFRNRGDGTFEDATAQSGIGKLPGGYGHGVTVGDYDNDGRSDLFLTRWRSYVLLRNRGDGTFDDVSERVGLGGDRDWPTASAFADLDGDGDLDLYVCHYVTWDTENPTICRKPGTDAYVYCDPGLLVPKSDHLFRNDNGKFVDVTESAGIVDKDGRGLGVVAADLDEDGRTDLFVANDLTANFLFQNRGNLRFEEVAHASGVAASAEGGYRANMGIALGDLDGDGKPDLAVTTYYNESTTFYHNLGGGIFADQTNAIGLAMPSRYLLGFGTGFFDFNNDGRLDLAIANGHVNDLRPAYPYAMPGLLMAGTGEGRLADVTMGAGSAWTKPRIGRAMALGDLDNDGRVDAVIVTLDGPLAYLHNLTQGGHYVTLRLEGSTSNRDAVGARVSIRTQGREQTSWRFGGGSYQSANDSRLHFGLGDAQRIDEIQVRWPTGHESVFRGLRADTGYLIREGRDEVESLRGFAPAPK